jgi:hypothetical protein
MVASWHIEQRFERLGAMPGHSSHAARAGDTAFAATDRAAPEFLGRLSFFSIACTFGPLWRMSPI